MADYETFGKETRLSTTQRHTGESRRRSSVTATLAAGFETANILKPPPKAEHGLPGGHSTTFASKGLDVHYRPAEHWEGLHRYDPDFTWEPSEEKALVRKLDWRVRAL